MTRALRLLLAASAAAFALPVVAETVPTGMLPRDVAPNAYRLDLTVDPALPRFSGRTEIDVTLKAPADHIWINGQDLRVTRVAAKVGGQTISGTYVQKHDEGVAELRFERPLPIGQATLAFEYDAPFIETGDFGLYRVKVGDSWYAWTTLQTTDARRVFPGFDEPGFKTPYSVVVRTPKGIKAYANGEDAGLASEGGLDRHMFRVSKPLPTYLFAIAVGAFAEAKGAAPPKGVRKTPLPLRTIATSEYQDRLAAPLRRTPAYVEALEAFFGLPFPYEKLDQISSPAVVAAMENAGLINYDNTSLLFGQEGSIRQQQRFPILLAHEIGHQWFGNLVTPAWWNDVWLNESFANWIGYRIGHQVEPTLGLSARLPRGGANAMGIDQLTVGKPVHVKSTNTIADADLDALAYGKGSQVIDMIESYMGPQTFQAAVRAYLKRHANGNATSDDFFAALGEIGKQPQIVAAMRSFIDQQGVPLLDVEEKGGLLKIRQSRFQPLGSPKPAPTQWTIPFCYRDVAGRQCVMMADETITIPDRGGLFIPNADGKGYWRFDLPAARWDRLIAAGRTLPTGEAILATDSLWAAAKRGKATPAQLVAATRAFADHPNVDVVADNGRRWMDWQRSGVISGSALARSRRLLDEVYSPILKRIGFEPRAGLYDRQTPAERNLRTETVAILAQGARAPAVRETLQRALRSYLAGDRAALDLSFVPIALETYVQDHAAATAIALREEALASKDSLFRDYVNKALAVSGRPDVAEALLGNLADPRLLARERAEVISGLTMTPATRSQVLAWVRRAVETDQLVPKVIPSLRAGSLEACSPEDIAAVQAIMTPKVMGGERGVIELERALETMRNCAAVKTTYADAIAASLN